MKVVPEAARSDAIGKLLEAQNATRNAERRRVPWKDSNIMCTVIEIEIDSLILNPRSHRIRAQIDGHPSANLLASAPESSEAQAIIAQLLRATEGYQDIKTSLEQDGQREPGVITCSGVLVNGNTRAVALDEINKGYIRVLVLPPSTNEQQISELELRLQVAKDFKQDYTFTNQLLFVRECLNEAGWTHERVAREVGYWTRFGPKKGEERVHQDERVLTIIDEIRQRSNNRYPYTFFDERKQALEEIDRDVENLRHTDPGAAIELRSARLIGVLAGLGYRELRHVQPGFVDDYLVGEIEEDDLLAPFSAGFFPDEEGSGQPTGLELLGSQDERNTSDSLLSWLVDTRGNSTVSIQVQGKKLSRNRDEIVGALREAMEAGAGQARDDTKREDLADQPGKRLREARQKVKTATETFKKARTDVRFDSSRFGKVKFRVKKLVKEVAILSDLIAREEERRK